MFDIIIAVNAENGIGINGKIPWRCPADLSHFRQLTENSILIVGRKTAETLPELPNRLVLTISNTKKCFKTFTTMKMALDFAKYFYPEKKVFVAGGAETYKTALLYNKNEIDKIHISHIPDNSPCDTYFDIKEYLTPQWKGVKTYFDTFTYEVLQKTENVQEKQYLKILQEILSFGTVRETRNGQTKSLFGKTMKFDLREGFPLLTTKKMFFRGIVEELLFFLRGETDSKILEEKGVNIWKGNTSRDFLDKLGMKERREGIMGPLYGYQWRYFNAKYDEMTGKPITEGVDQLKNVIETIIKDPFSRRIIMTDFNPAQALEGVLYPCHSIVLQFYVSEGHLDMSCYNRSQDTFLGTPFNIASSALLLSLISKVTNLSPRYLHMNLGDVHIYESHYSVASKQIKRTPYSFPKLILKDIKTLQELENLQFSDINIENYVSHPAIKAEMVS